MVIHAVAAFGGAKNVSVDQFMPQWQPRPVIDYAGFYERKMAEFEAAKR
jgi:hypothetical protein